MVDKKVLGLTLILLVILSTSLYIFSIEVIGNQTALLDIDVEAIPDEVPEGSFSPVIVTIQNDNDWVSAEFIALTLEIPSDVGIGDFGVIDSMGPKQKTQIALNMSLFPDIEVNSFAYNLTVNYYDGSTFKDELLYGNVKVLHKAVFDVSSSVHYIAEGVYSLNITLTNVGRSKVDWLKGQLTISPSNFELSQSIRDFGGNILQPGANVTWNIVIRKLTVSPPTKYNFTLQLDHKDQAGTYKTNITLEPDFFVGHDYTFTPNVSDVVSSFLDSPLGHNATSIAERRGVQLNLDKPYLISSSLTDMDIISFFLYHKGFFETTYGNVSVPERIFLGVCGTANRSVTLGQSTTLLSSTEELTSINGYLIETLNKKVKEPIVTPVFYSEYLYDHLQIDGDMSVVSVNATFAVDFFMDAEGLESLLWRFTDKNSPFFYLHPQIPLVKISWQTIAGALSPKDAKKLFSAVSVQDWLTVKPLVEKAFKQSELITKNVLKKIGEWLGFYGYVGKGSVSSIFSAIAAALILVLTIQAFINLARDAVDAIKAAIDLIAWTVDDIILVKNEIKAICKIPPEHKDYTRLAQLKAELNRLLARYYKDIQALLKLALSVAQTLLGNIKRVKNALTGLKTVILNIASKIFKAKIPGWVLNVIAKIAGAIGIADNLINQLAAAIASKVPAPGDP